MGRTNATYRDHLDAYEQRCQSFRRALRRERKQDFDRVFELAEHDSLSLAATTMTGPAGWVYWQPRTLEIFNAVRELRTEADVPVYFSVDTGASVYVNTTAEHVDRVEEAVADCGVDTRQWEVGGPAQVLDESDALF